MVTVVVAVVVGVAILVIVGVVGVLALIAWGLRRAEEEDLRCSLDWRLVPDPHGDVPHIPPDYRRELHQDRQRAWPEGGEPRGA